MKDQMRTPLGRVYGLGSAHGGAHDWWLSRLTSLALVPLGIWWIAAIIAHAGAGYAEFVDWVREPVTAVLLVLSIVVMFYHTMLGLQVVIEDYVESTWARMTALVLIKFGSVVLTVAGLFGVLRISLGS